MNMNNFLSYLQQLLTMMDPGDLTSRTLAKNALMSTIALAISSNKVDPMTHRMMLAAEVRFDVLLHYRDHFVGVPGELEKNAQKRQRMADVLLPHC